MRTSIAQDLDAAGRTRESNARGPPRGRERSARSQQRCRHTEHQERAAHFSLTFLLPKMEASGGPGPGAAGRAAAAAAAAGAGGRERA